MIYRNKKILDEARNHPCQMCGADDGTVVAAHANWGWAGKGMGIKAHDLPAYLCSICHHQIDQGFLFSKAEKQQLWWGAFEKSVPLYFHLLDMDGAKALEELYENRP